MQLGFPFAPKSAPTRCASLQPMRDYQERAVAGIHTSLAKYDDALCISATGTGKCLGRGTPVLMADGRIVPVEEIGEGAKLQGPDGQVRQVLSITDGVGELWRIVPVKGDPWVCNDVHVLTLVHTETGAVVDVPLNEYVRKSKTWKRCHKLFRSPVLTEHVEDEPLPVDPYFLGLWLGDGSLRGGGISICKPDEEIRAACEAEAARWGLELRTHDLDRCPQHFLCLPVRGRGRRNPLACAILDMGLTASDRFVPMRYKRSHPVERRRLLAGLLDSDGSLSNNGFDWISMYPLLADAVAYLARSVGLAAHVSQCQKSCQGGFTGTYYRVFISGDTDTIPTRIPRKQAKPRGQKKDVLRTGFSVEPIGRGEFFGFELDGDGRFLLGDFTVTHNTRIFTEVVHLWPQWMGEFKAKSDRVLILVDRDELATQAVRRLRNETGEDVGREQAESRAADERIVVASVQTLLRPQRLNTFRPDAFGMVIYDEVHHAVAPTRREVVKYFRDGGCKLVGVTATPDRADEKPLAHIFKSCAEDAPAFVYEIHDAIADGWLVDFDIRVTKVDAIDFSQVRKVHGELAQGQVEAIIAAEDALHGIAKPTVLESGEMRVLGFTPGVNSARLLSSICDRYAYPGWARWMAGGQGMDLEGRRRVVAGHQRGDFRGLWNCNVATEGYDDPALGCLAMARPTLSRMLFAQMLGRGTRPVFPPGFDSLRATAEERRAAIARSTKPTIRVLEFTGNCGKHELSCAVDVLGGNYDPPIVAKAKAIVAKDGGSPGEALKRALREAEELRLAELAARARITAHVQYHVDPFELMHMKGRDDGWAKRFSGDPATEAQIKYLCSLGVPADEAKKMSKAQAIRMLNTCIKRQEVGKARYSQVVKMRAVGIDGFNLSYQQACDMCWEIQQARGKRPAEDKIAAIMGRGK
jgi:superfamily II DNA or RNA helicase